MNHQLFVDTIAELQNLVKVADEKIQKALAAGNAAYVAALGKAKEALKDDGEAMYELCRYAVNPAQFQFSEETVKFLENQTKEEPPVEKKLELIKPKVCR